MKNSIREYISHVTFICTTNRFTQTDECFDIAVLHTGIRFYPNLVKEFYLFKQPNKDIRFS